MQSQCKISKNNVTKVCESPKFKTKLSHLILVNFCLFEFRFALFLKCDDDQSDEDIDEEKGEDDEVDDVEDGHFDSEQWDRGLILKCGRH